MNRLTLTVLLMAELTRKKFGRVGSLTHPKIEQAARYRFADQVGIPRRSRPDKYIAAIKQVCIDNGILDNFNNIVKQLS